MADQAANNGGGQGAGKKFVSFSRSAAQRIANAVRIVEGGDRGQPGLTFDHPNSTGAATKVLRLATFSGSWNINTVKTVTFQNLPTSTASVTNLHWPITLTGYTNETVIVGKEGTAWYLVVPPLEAATAVVDVQVGATLNTVTCAITVARTVVTSTSSFLRIKVP